MVYVCGVLCYICIVYVLRIIADLKAEADRLVSVSVTETTSKAYKRFVDKFKTFAARVGISQKSMFTTKSVVLWVAELSKDGLTYGSVRTHLSGLRHYCKGLGILDPLDSPRLQLMLRGLRRTQASQEARPCLAVSEPDLRKLCGTLGRYSNSRALRLKAMITMAFYGFLRPSEYCLTNAGHALKWRDVQVEKKGRALRLNFKTYKHSQTPVVVTVRAVTDERTCPVKAFVKYKRFRSPADLDGWIFEDSAAEFSSEFKDLCDQASIRSHLTPHSLRRGGATWAANVGWSDAKIRAHGRWKSSAFLQYVRPQ